MKEIRIKLEIIHREKIGKELISITFKELLPNKKMIKTLGGKSGPNTCMQTSRKRKANSL